MTRGNKKKKRKNTVVPENLIYRSASLDGIEIGNPDHRTDNGSNNNTNKQKFRECACMSIHF